MNFRKNDWVWIVFVDSLSINEAAWFLKAGIYFVSPSYVLVEIDVIATYKIYNQWQYSVGIDDAWG